MGSMPLTVPDALKIAGGILPSPRLDLIKKRAQLGMGRKDSKERRLLREDLPAGSSLRKGAETAPME